MLVATVVVSNLFVARDRSITSGMLGHDFLAFYTAGTFARTGQFDLLYDLDAVRTVEDQIAQTYQLDKAGLGPFWNPPFFAWVFAPLSALHYPAALTLWTLVNLLALAGAIVLLCRMLPAGADWRIWALVPLLVLVSMPFLQAVTHGQNTCTSLLLLCGVVTCWRKQWDMTAGLICGLMFYKPQLAAVVAVLLMFTRGWRAGAGLGLMLGMLLIATAVSMPGAISHYVRQLPLNVHWAQVENVYLWERHVTLKGLWRLLLHGREAGEIGMIAQALTMLTCSALAAGLIVMILRHYRAGADDVFTGETRFIRRDRLIVASIVAMPLLMPFYLDYDLLLLSVPAVLFGSEILLLAPGRKLDRNERWICGLWIALYLWMLINPGFARISGINVTTILLTALAALLIQRACRKVELSQFGIRPAEIIRVTARRAA